jgi:hypothetical protein
MIRLRIRILKQADAVIRKGENAGDVATSRQLQPTREPLFNKRYKSDSLINLKAEEE